MVKKVFLEIVTQYSKWNVIELLAYAIAYYFLCNMGEPAYINWFSPCLLSVAYGFGSSKIGKRPAKAYFFTPPNRENGKYIKCRFWMETAMVFSILNFFQILGYVYNVMIRKQEVFGNYIGVNPILEVMQFVLVVCFCMTIVSRDYRQKVLGENVMESKPAAKLYIADFIMIFIFTVALGIIGTGEHMKYCIIYYILFLGVTVALLAANVRFVRDTMKAIYQLEAH